MSEQWSPTDIDNLIQLVQSQPEIYDQRRPGYTNMHVIDKLWSDIAKEFPTKTVTQLKKKWQILRSGYRQRRVEKQLPSGSGTKSFRKWPYFEMLSFLEPFLLERRQSNIKLSSSDDQFESKNRNHSLSENTNIIYVKNENDLHIEAGDEEEGESIIMQVDEDDGDDVDSALSSPQASTSRDETSTSLSTSRLQNPVDETIITYLQSKCKQLQHNEAKEKSSNELFLFSLLEDMNKLPNRELRQFKIEILNLLNEKLDNLE